MDEDYDSLDDILLTAPSKGEAVKLEHEMLNKAASHPLRRALVKAIGTFGIGSADLFDAVDSDSASIKYHLDFLRNGEFVKIEDSYYRLTDKGLELLSNCDIHPRC